MARDVINTVYIGAYLTGVQRGVLQCSSNVEPLSRFIFYHHLRDRTGAFPIIRHVS